MWKRIGKVVLASFAAWSFLLLLEGTNRGFGGLFIGQEAPFIHKAILDGAIALFMGIGMEVWMLMELSEE